MAPIRPAGNPTPAAVARPTVEAPKPPPPPPPPPPRRGVDDGHSSFQTQPRTRAPMDLSGGVPVASTLRNEVLGDGSANCLERANTLSRPGDSVLLLNDSRDGVGHALVRHPDGSVVDPNEPGRTWKSLGEWQSAHPSYGQPVAVPDAQLARLLSVPPGPAREALIHGFGLSGAANRQVADSSVTTTTPSVETTPSGTLSTDGTITLGVTQTFKPQEIEFERGRLSGSITSGPYAESQVELSWNPAQPTADGRYVVTVTYENTVGMQAEGGLEFGPFGAEHGTQSGTSASRSYELVLTEAELRQLQTGQYTLPSVADPLSMPVGSQVVMEESQFSTTSSGLSYGPLSLSGESGSEHTQSIATERTGDTTVRVTVGPTDALTSSLKLGIGFTIGGQEVGASIGSERSWTEGTAASVEFDLATPEGKAAYENFLTTGQLPTQTGPGVLDVRSQQTQAYEGSLGAEVHLGDFLNLEHQFWDESLKETVTTVNGQTTVLAEGDIAGSDNSFAIQYSVNPDGTRQFESMTLNVLNPDNTSYTRLTVTGDEGLASLQNLAIQQAQEMVFNYFVGPDGFADANAARQQMRTEGEPWSTLAMQPGDAGFTPEGWLEAYREASFRNGSIPSLPVTTMNLLEATPDALPGLLFQGLGTADHDSQNPLHSYQFGNGENDRMTGWLEMGAGQLPGIQVG